MKVLTSLLLAPLLSACTVHFHIYEAERAAPPAQAVAASHSSAHTQLVVSGVVRDVDGTPIRARVAAVTESGSVASTTDDQGKFSLPLDSASDFVLHASTQDSRIAVERSHAGASDVELALRPGGVLVIDMVGHPRARCAVFWDHLRIEDFTLRQGESVKVVVPEGELRVRLYEGDQVLQERQFDVGVGKTEAASFRLQS